MVILALPERRQRSHVKRLFERRAAGGEDLRLIHCLKQLGWENVKTELEIGGFADRKLEVQEWLKANREPESEPFSYARLGVMTGIGIFVGLATLNLI